jgi:hypothetical protein
MPRYHFDFKNESGITFATHEVDYVDDHAAVEAGHLINGFPFIGCCFQIWREGRLVHWHHNKLAILN